jgi:WD40 repeat protein
MSEVILETRHREKGEKDTFFSPFPGLRPFGVEESHLFFGREGQCEEIVASLAKKRFVAVMGPSGSGKSSLIYCGLVPILHGGFIAKAGSHWRVISFRSGNSPVNNLAKAITSGLYDEENFAINRTITETVLLRSSLGLVEAIKQSNRKEDENVLLVVDQFEELFRFKKGFHNYASFNESEAFVRLLVEAVSQQNLPIYMVLTIRSDFIGDCAQFHDLTGLINDSYYLLPNMTRDDFRYAITGPITVSGARIESRLVDQLLNDVGSNTDQLPILQHALMRTWDHWLLSSDPDVPIGLADYEAVGKMEKALSEHANEAYDELSEEGKRICESMFKTLTEKGNDNRETRHPATVEEIAEISVAPVEQVYEVIEVFRQPGRSFLTPIFNVAINKDTIIDLSHESLMRVWDRLKDWVEDEAASVQMYKRLADAAALYQATRTGLLKPPELTLALAWEKKQQPVLTWAKRYNPALERTKVYIRASEKEYEAEENQKISLQKRSLRRMRLFAIVLGFTAIIAVLMTLYTKALRDDAEKAKIMAQLQKKIADEQSLIALKKSKEADEQREIALKQKADANEQRNVAETQKQSAVLNAESANFKSAIAINKTKESEEQQVLAINQANEAFLQQKEAEKAREEAFKRRMLSVAKSMSVKSLQINQDKDLKGLLAYQAFIFNRKYGGSSRNADIYSGLYDATNVLNGPFYNVYKGHTDAVNSLAFIPNQNVFFSAGSDGLVYRWDLDADHSKPKIIINNKVINKVIAVSNDGKWLACGTNGLGLEVFDLKSGNPTPKYFKTTAVSIVALCFLTDKKHVVTSAEDNRILEWDLESGSNKELAKTSALVLSLSASPDGRLIAASTKDGKIILLNIQNNSMETLYDGKKNTTHALAFNHNGQVLASGDVSGNLNYWNVNKRSIITSLHAHSARITDLKFSPDDKLLASASFDATVQLWFTGDFSIQPIKLKDHESWVLSVAFSPSGDRVVSGSLKENRLSVSPSDAKFMAESICNKLGRNMTQAEWGIYVGKDIPYEKTCDK